MKEKKGSVNSEKAVTLTQPEQQKEKRMKKSENSLKDLWNNIKWTNIHIIGLPEREERKGQKSHLK